MVGTVSVGRLKQITRKRRTTDLENIYYKYQTLKGKEHRSCQKTIKFMSFYDVIWNMDPERIRLLIKVVYNIQFIQFHIVELSSSKINKKLWTKCSCSK